MRWFEVSGSNKIPVGSGTRVGKMLKEMYKKRKRIIANNKRTIRNRTQS